jgi:hypothetical protein
LENVRGQQAKFQLGKLDIIIALLLVCVRFTVRREMSNPIDELSTLLQKKTVSDRESVI